MAEIESVRVQKEIDFERVYSIVVCISKKSKKYSKKIFIKKNPRPHTRTLNTAHAHALKETEDEKRERFASPGRF